MSDAISGLLGAIVGGLAAIGGAWLQARNAAKLQRQEAAGQEEQRRAERRRSSKSADSSSRVATSISSGKPWTRYCTALITGRIVAGLDGLKGCIPVTGK